MTPQEFCREVMHEMEEQWARAMGHQARHPLREKMRVLCDILSRARTVDEMDQILRQGKESEDPILWMLCQELEPRWEAAKKEVGQGSGADG